MSATSGMSAALRGGISGMPRCLAQRSSVRQLWRLARLHKFNCRCSASEGQRSVSADDRAIASLSAAYNTEPDFPSPGMADGRLRVTPAAEGEHELGWEQWSEFFDEMDEAASRANELDDLLSAAVAEEDYVQAASVKAELDAMLQRDTVAAVLKELDTALANEDYAAASRLRDEGGAGLVGWWCGRGEEDDPHGHLLHVSTDFGRYVGTAYLAKDLAEHKGWTEETFFRGPAVERAPRKLEDLGTPVMEVFVQRREDGGYTRQVCALSPLGEETTEVTVTLTAPGVQEDLSVAVESSSEEEQYLKFEVQRDGSVSSAPGLPDGGNSVMDDDTASSSGLLMMGGGNDGDDDEAEVEFLMNRVQAGLTMSGRNAFEFEVQGNLHGEDEEEEEEEDGEEGGSGQGGDVAAREQGGASVSGDSEADTDARELHDTLLKFAQGVQRGQQMSDEDVEELRKVTQDLVGGVRSGRAATLNAVAQVSVAPRLPFSCGKVRYTRLATDAPKTDPLSGLYLGAFGPHGPELLQLSRGRDSNGDEMVYGVKVTGDPNVPAGSLSFRAKVGRRARLTPHDDYPPDLGVMARYKGEGRIASPGYRNPRWVEGELLQFSTASPVTRGAQLGFVWSVPGEKKFLILLNRVDFQ